MASESTDSQDVAVSLPDELIEWLEEHAAELDVDRDALLEGLVASYRQTAELDGQRPPQPGVVPADSDELKARIDAVERDFQTKLEDVRERVVQVKRETDQKAPADHDHEAFDRLDRIEQRLERVAAEVAQLDAGAETHDDEERLGNVQADVESLRETVDERADRLDDVEQKLRTVGWAVSDLREEVAKQGTDTLDRIKDAAARHDVSRAVCENCGEGVEIALLQRPACPHCSAAVTDVEPSSGFFGKPSLVAASQIEAGEEEGSTGSDVTAKLGDDRQ